MKVIRTADMRELDRRTIEEAGVPGAVLMDRAARGVAEAVWRIARVRGALPPAVLLAAGRGNNGGDALAAARYLAEWGARVTVRLAAEPDSVKGDARLHLDRLLAAGIPFQAAPDAEGWRSVEAWRVPPDAILVDGLLGTGLAGPARDTAAAAIRGLNELGRRHPVVAIDVPSGLDSDTGRPGGEAVRADLTVTMGYPKLGLLAAGALDYVGSLEVIDIGIPPAYAAGLSSERELITGPEVRALLPRRPRAAHKGAFGHVLIVGGAAGYTGAAAMAAQAAVRSGAGLVSVLCPARLAPAIAAGVPEAMVHFGAETPEGSLAGDCLERWGRDLSAFHCVLAGPGLTTGAASRAVVESVLSRGRCPVVLDADALNVFAGQPEALRRAAGGVVLTPHPGELGRLLGCSAAQVQAARETAAAQAAARCGGVVVLKGAGTVVCAEGRLPHINGTGNPGMAKGGSGDVLAGLLAGLLAQGQPPWDAARCAVYLHGSAGDDAAWRRGQASMTPTDLVDALPGVIQRL